MMKKYIKIILASVMSVALLIGCYPEMDELTADYTSDGGNVAIVEFTKVNSSFFDLSDIDNAFINFEIDSKGGKIESVSIIQTFNGVSTEVLNVTTLPAIVNITSQQAATTAGVEVADFVLGDVFTYETVVNASNGSSYRSNAGVVSASVSCQSNLDGTYTVLASGSSTDSGPTADENPIADYESEITLTSTSAGVYNMSDFSGGLYELWYDIYGISGDTPGTFQDICGNLTMINTIEPFATEVVGGGSVDSDTGVITISAENGYGDKWTIVLTPKP